ncbi:MAG: GAF domain-containing protein [Flavobacteriales bacterium]|nr:GAF domain-containing protein [Flavobacteriales bacterium]
MEAPITLPTTTDRASIYAALHPQVEALLATSPDAISAMANLSAALHAAFGWHWVGFYRVVGNELVLGPFQGPVACTRIGFGKGVCGSAWQQERTMVVPDVELFPGHIACSSLSRSEIVVPLRNGAGKVVAVLDVDSTEVADFDTLDAEQLAMLCAPVEALLG